MLSKSIATMLLDISKIILVNKGDAGKSNRLTEWLEPRDSI